MADRLVLGKRRVRGAGKRKRQFGHFPHHWIFLGQDRGPTIGESVTGRRLVLTGTRILSPLRRSRFGLRNHALFHDTGFQPLADQSHNARIADSMFNEPHQPLVAETVENFRCFA